MEKRYNSTGELELLIKWRKKSILDHSWMLYQEFITSFPSYQLEGKLNFVGGSIDRYKAYYRKRKGKGGLEVENEES